MSEEAEKQYVSSLANLTINSKPTINILTMLADQNRRYAEVVVKAIENHICNTVFRLPGLYLLDSVLKNVAKEYVNLFSINIVSIFISVFEKSIGKKFVCQAGPFSSETTYEEMLRQHVMGGIGFGRGICCRNMGSILESFCFN